MVATRPDPPLGTETSPERESGPEGVKDIEGWTTGAPSVNWKGRGRRSRHVPSLRLEGVEEGEGSRTSSFHGKSGRRRGRVAPSLPTGTLDPSPDN